MRALLESLFALVPPVPLAQPLFSFAQFLTTFGLLMVVYTLSDVRYRFRIQIAPIRLVSFTYLISIAIGIGTLVTGVWFEAKWPLPRIFSVQLYWQTSFAALFLAVAVTWLWFSFFRPPKYGRLNCKDFSRAVYFYILKGSSSELPIIADELRRCAYSLVRRAPREQPAIGNAGHRESIVTQIAHDIFLIIGNRRFCKAIIGSSPGTAITIFQCMSQLHKYQLPVGQFAANLSTEALNDEDSLLYHEKSGYYSGYIGYAKPCSSALYGDWQLIEALATRYNQCQLDIDLHLSWNWNSNQLAAYGRSVLITLRSYIKETKGRNHSYSIYRAIDNLENGAREVYKLNGKDEYSGDNFTKLRRCVEFCVERLI
jgi:hypothetical protein